MTASSRISNLLAALARTRRRHWRFMARAWLVAPSIELSMRAAGVKRTLAWLDQLPQRQPHDGRVGIDEAAQLVRWACKLQPLTRNACLTQSLVQYALHRRDGVSARFVIGVRHHAGAAEDDAGGAQQPRSAADASSRHSHSEALRQLDAHAWVQAPAADSTAPGFAELLQQDSA